MNLNKALAVSLTFSLLAILMPTTLRAASKVYNNTDGDAWVFWQASGCAAIRDWECPKGGDIAFICGKKKVAASKEVKYSFNAGSSKRKIHVQACSTSFSDYYDSGSDSTGNSGPEHRCVLSANSQYPSRLDVRCGYNQSDYQAIKGTP